MDLRGSGEITRDEFQSSLSQLGLKVSEETTYETVDSIDLDHSGYMDQHEFTAFMERKVSRLKIVAVVAKILIGLGQVISKQEDTMQQKLPGPQWHSNLLDVVQINVGFIAPICDVGYTTRFLLNIVALPLSLVLLVSATWATNKGLETEATAGTNVSGQGKGSGTQRESAAEERKSSKRADYYLLVHKQSFLVKSSAGKSF